MITGMSDHESMSLHFSAVVYSPVRMGEISSDLERDLEVQGTWSSRTLLSSSPSISTADFFPQCLFFPTHLCIYHAPLGTREGSMEGKLGEIRCLHF